MSVSGHKSMQSLAIYQKTKDKKKIQMGKALFQSMTRNEDEIDVTPNKKELPAPCKNQAIMPAPQKKQTTTETAIAPYTPLQNKENVTAEMVLFEPNFGEDDLSDMDILSAICGVPEITTTVSNTSNTTSNVLNTIPKAMFANCQIGSININFGKK